MGFAHGLRNQQVQAVWDSKEDIALYVLGYASSIRERGEDDMKQTSNKEIAAVFKEAKKYLARSWAASKNMYICIAIDEVGRRNHRLFDSCSCAIKIINERLDGKVGVGTWLKDNGFITDDDLRNMKYREQLQEYRHSWLDSLIKEFSK